MNYKKNCRQNWERIVLYGSGSRPSVIQCKCTIDYIFPQTGERSTFTVDDSWRMIGVGLVVILIVSIVSLVATCIHRV